MGFIASSLPCVCEFLRHFPALCRLFLSAAGAQTAPARQSRLCTHGLLGFAFFPSFLTPVVPVWSLTQCT